MKNIPQSKTRASWLIMLITLFATQLAHAELRYVKLDNDARWTFIWCAMILAAGMIIAAIILKRPK